MANMASVAYAIEGSEESLMEIFGAICLAVDGDHYHWEEYQTCINLGFTPEEIEDKRLGGEISDTPSLSQGVMRFSAEERWGLQDFEELLIQKFPDIKVYWVVEESGCDVYCTNDKEGKYFPDRFYADVCVNGQFESEYFVTEEAMFKWLSLTTHWKIESYEDAEAFEKSFVDTDAEDDNFICIHKFEIED